MGLKTELRRLLVRKGIRVPRFLVRKHDRVFHEALSRIRPGMIVLDLGAHRGETAEAFAARGAKVHAYEPNPDVFLELETRARSNGRIVPVNAGVLDRSGEMPLYLHENYADDPSRHSESSSLLSEKPNVSASGARSVAVLDILDIVDGIGAPIDVMKLDVEGAEYRILRRLIESRAVDSIAMIYVETHHDRIPGLAAEYEALRALITERRLGSRIRFDWA